MATKSFVKCHSKYHENDVWGLPPSFFVPCVSMVITKAAKRLGMSRNSLNRHADGLGLIVMRRQDDHRYFLNCQIDMLREGKSFDAKTLRRAVKGGENGIKALISKTNRG